VRADDLEPILWLEIERVLSDLEVSRGELARQEQQGVAAQRELDTFKELRVIQKALDALERAAQRWDKT